MIFNGNNGEELELRVLGYQYPSNIEGDWDSNWQRIYNRLVSRSGSWQMVDASLTTWELKKLINWLNDIFEDNEVLEPELTFTEPNFSFLLISKTPKIKTLKMHFDLESRPQSADDNTEYFIELQMGKFDIKKVLFDLEIEYERFPVRYAQNPLK